MKKTLTTLATLAGFAACTAAHATIVYQDNFDNDGLATNTGTGGGLIEFNATNGGATGLTVADDGNLTSPSTGHNNRGNFFSTSSFDLTGGFTLTASVDLLSGNVANGIAARHDFGLVSTSTTLERKGLLSGSDEIAFALINTGGTAGLSYEGTSVDSSLSVDGAAGFQAISITIAANGLDYTYAVGGASQSGTLASAFDFSKEYHVAGSFQDAESYGVYESITLETVPEPSSTALLGLGGLALLMRRRK